MNEQKLADVFEKIESSREDQIQFLSHIVHVPAVSPSLGGKGESEKVELILNLAKAMGFTSYEMLEAPDGNASSGVRPNLVVWLKGDSSGNDDTPRLLVLTHTDIVPPGNIDAWNSDPYTAIYKDGKIFGRGTEDNGQSLTSALFAAKALLDMNIIPAADIGLVMVADEEVDNQKGILHLLATGFFRNNDLIIVPDHGEPEGRLVDVSEKSIAWVKVTTTGVQCHASIPAKGNNAFRAAMKFGTMVDPALSERFDIIDPSFDHPVSSFEPTRKEANVENINTVPGVDVFYIDCRVIPQYKLKDVLDEMRRIADIVQKETGSQIALEPVLLEEAAPPTPTSDPIVQKLLGAIDRVYKNDPYTGGIGGGTVAAVLRNAGYNVAVWETIENTAHSPNEYALIDNMINDCKVFATLFLDLL